MELDLQSLFGLHDVHSCTHWHPPSPRIWALLVSQDRRHLFDDPLPVSLHVKKSILLTQVGVSVV
jgi:hypothetical protein